MATFMHVVTGADMAYELESNDDDAVTCFLNYAKNFQKWTNLGKIGLRKAFEEEVLSEADKVALNAFADFLKECAA